MSLSESDFDYIRQHVRKVPDFPKPGILFIDITTAVKDSKAFKLTLDYLQEQAEALDCDMIAGIESRGFIYGAPLADRMGKGLIMIRKPNKLPADTISESYELEYGKNTIEMHKDAIKPGTRVLLIDDLLATGGTAIAAAKLIRKVGGEVAAIMFAIELDKLNGRKNIEEHGIKVVSMLHYENVG